MAYVQHVDGGGISWFMLCYGLCLHSVCTKCVFSVTIFRSRQVSCINKLGKDSKICFWIHILLKHITKHPLPKWLILFYSQLIIHMYIMRSYETYVLWPTDILWLTCLKTPHNCVGGGFIATERYFIIWKLFTLWVEYQLHNGFALLVLIWMHSEEAMTEIIDLRLC